MPRKRIQDYIIEKFAFDRRVIVADWRVHIAYVQIAHSHGYVLPDSSKLNSVIRQLVNADQLEQIQQVRGVYRVIVPFASAIPSTDESVVQEANPTAVFCHSSAFAYHRLTDEIPGALHLYDTHGKSDRIPLGTAQDDWVDVPEPARRRPTLVGNRPIFWSRLKQDWDFGYMVGYELGVPVYVTDLERTLIDSLRFPDKCGGVIQAFDGWSRASEVFDVNRIVDYASRIGQTLLCQRVGFVLEELGCSSATLDDWAAKSIRGSSAKLAANEPFSPNYSERWNLSINVPNSVISLLEG